jgi:hypothetical protein
VHTVRCEHGNGTADQRSTLLNGTQHTVRCVHIQALGASGYVPSHHPRASKHFDTPLKDLWRHQHTVTAIIGHRQRPIRTVSIAWKGGGRRDGRTRRPNVEQHRCGLDVHAQQHVTAGNGLTPQHRGRQLAYRDATISW